MSHSGPRTISQQSSQEPPAPNGSGHCVCFAPAQKKRFPGLFVPGAPWGHYDPRNLIGGPGTSTEGVGGHVADSVLLPGPGRCRQSPKVPARSSLPAPSPRGPPPTSYSLQPALGRPSGHHIGNDHRATGPVPAAGDGNAEATAGVLGGGTARMSFCPLPMGTQVLESC